MLDLIQTNDLSFYNDMGILSISAKQYDTGRKFIFNIINNDEPFDMTGCTAYLRIKKSDGTQFQGEECCSINENQIIVDTSIGNGDQILSCKGINTCELHLTDTLGNSLTTWDFIINVAQRVHNCDNINSVDSFDTLDMLSENILRLSISIDQNNKDIANLKNNKVDKIDGKALSTNDYTDEDKELVSTIINKVNYSSLDNFMTKNDPRGTGSLFLNGEKGIPIGENAVAVGYHTRAYEKCSFAEGMETIANSEMQHVQGKYNELDYSNKYAHIVGGGSSKDDRKNIHTLDWRGNAYFAGDVISTNNNGDRVSLNSLYDDISNNVDILNNVSGENINIRDSVNAGVREFQLFGKVIYQEEEEYRNFLQTTAESQVKNGITFTVNDDKSITINGTNTSADSVSFDICGYSGVADNMDNIPKEDLFYTFRGIDENIMTSITFYNSEAMWEAGKFLVNSNSILIKQSEINNATGLHICLSISGGESVDCTVYPMISREGEIYQPYKDNSNYDVDNSNTIRPYGDKGNIVIRNVGKNLLRNEATTQTIHGVTFTVNEDKSVRIKGTNDGTAKSTLFLLGSLGVTNNISEIPKSDLILSGGEFIKASFFNEDGYELRDGLSTGNGVINIRKELVSLSKGFAIYLSIDENQSVDTIVYPMIRAATDNDAIYEPYHSYTFSLQTTNGLAGIPVSSGGNYTDQNGKQWICDEIVKYDDGSCSYIKRVDKVVFDGSDDESWKSTTTSASGTYRNLSTLIKGKVKKASDSNAKGNGICTGYNVIASGTSGTYGRRQGISVAIDGNIYVYDNRYNTSDISLWKNHLSEQPITFYYELAEYIITKLEPEETDYLNNMSTFYNVTNIYNDSNCEMSIRYIKDNYNNDFVEDVYSKLHVHNNYDVLANTTASYTTEEKVKLSEIKTPVNNLSTTTPGSPLDAMQGKALNDKIDQLVNSLWTEIENLRSQLQN